MKKQMLWKTKGMNQDLSVSAFNPEFSFENMNLRLSTNEGNTLMSWVNEKGTASIALIDSEDKEATISGIPIGTAVINQKLVIFTTTNQEKEAKADADDYIYKLEYTDDKRDTMLVTQLFKGNLNFSTKNPLETLVSYEAKTIQKVYWVDGRNQPRLINIEAPTSKYYSGTDPINTHFDFLPTLNLQETVTVEKLYDAIGMFAPGVIQYAFTYYNKYGQESSIFYVTPLQYISYRERGGSPEDKINNSFKITINGVDDKFEYLRIYSIQRTSLNATPFCKRLQDLEVDTMGTDSNGKKYSVYVDTGTNGDTIDPTELLYKGGETISVGTIEQKDNTLFLGDINMFRKPLPDNIRTLLEAEFTPKEAAINNNTETEHAVMKTVLAEFSGVEISKDDIPYVNTIDHSGFKWREVYRIAIQFQHETGKWSDPVWLRDFRIKKMPTNVDSWTWDNNGFPKDGTTTNKVYLPEVEVKITDNRENGIYNTLKNSGYKRARLLMAQPTISGRTILCQGIANKTVFTQMKRFGRAATDTESPVSETLYGQASWLFRPNSRLYLDFEDTTAPGGGGYIPGSGYNPNNDTGELYDTETLAGLITVVGTERTGWHSPRLNSIEIGAVLGEDNQFKIDECFFTIHSPELIFDETLYSEDWKSAGVCMIGSAYFQNTFGDIDIQTKTPTIGSAPGFLHKAAKVPGNAALISGLYYEDFIVDDYDEDNPKYNRYPNMHVPVQWPIFMWHKNGSLNNDVNRDARSAELTKKRISNYHVSKFNIPSAVRQTDPNPETVYYRDQEYTYDIQLFNNDELSVIKVNGHTYMGNIDTSLTPEEPQFKYFVGNPWRNKKEDDDEEHRTKVYWRLGLKDPGDSNSRNGFWEFKEFNLDAGTVVWTNHDGDWTHVGDYVPDLCESSEPIRMKYKSTPHLVCAGRQSTNYRNGLFTSYTRESALPLVDLVKSYDKTTFYGGQSDEALKANIWLPICNPVDLSSEMTLTSEWGDTWYQRFECLKTYPFTNEDVNQVVEIASFMVETHINIDGRYDRNRGQTSNLNMSPRNFNLYNPIYSQANNFFNYRILDADAYKNTHYTNQVTWSKTKESGADVDLWTNITLASVLELDGDKGSISKIARLNDQLLAFQDKGIAQLLYNENTQISTTEGVPIEIANSGKVQGKRYLSSTVGCSNKWSIVNTPAGIYFMDSNDKSIYRLGEGLQNISQQQGFNTWCKTFIPPMSSKWSPDEFNNFVAYYDKKNQDVLFINNTEALAYSEKFGTFTSFYDYGATPYLCSLDDTGIWVKAPYSYKDDEEQTVNVPCKLWLHQEGDYCNFFGSQEPYSMTLVGNSEPQMDKIFTNLEFRACVEGDGEQTNAGKFIPTLPFDSLETWDEYQHGLISLENKNGHSAMQHHTSDGISSLKRKFRIWRCDIPRDNVIIPTIPSEGTEEEIATAKAARQAVLDADAALGVSRVKAHPIDRMRNPWLYLKLQKDADTNKKVEIHDMMMTYFT